MAAKKRKRTTKPRAGSELTRARVMSSKFHGSPNHVIELSAGEQHIGKYVVALGVLPEVAYEPLKGSKRSGVRWVHKAGDRGMLRKGSKRRPLLAADPKTGRILIVPMRSPMKFKSDRGIIG